MKPAPLGERYNMKEDLKIIKIQDSYNGERQDVYLVKTSLDWEDLRRVIGNIIARLRPEDIEWSYDAVMEELERGGLVKIIDVEQVSIYV